MTQRDRRARRRIALGSGVTAAAVGLALVALPSSAGAADPDTPTAPELGGAEIGKQDEDLLAEAREKGRETVEVLLATERGIGTAAVDAVAGSDATIKFRDDRLGYIRAEVPTDSVKKVATLPGIAALDIDDVIKVDDPRPADQDDPTPQPPPGADTPSVNPYLPTGDTGAAQFVDNHPRWDGRGVTVGIVDTGIDLDHPSLATTSTGERKVVDWVAGTDPGFTDGVNNDNDPSWVDMSTEVSGSTVPVNGTDYTAPADGDYRVGVFDERDPRLGGQIGNDVDRDGNPDGSVGTFGVLWEPATDTVWVDTNQNSDFSDDAPMTNYRVKHDIDTFGTDDEGTEVREAMDFVVQTSPDTNSVNIGIVSGAHGSHVAGIVAGNSLFGGDMDGAAPGAKLVSVRACLFVAGCTNHALMEGMIYAARDAKVDVINMSIGGLSPLNDGSGAQAQLYNRLIDTYGVQMFISAGNEGAGVNTIGSPSDADKVVSVGSYISKLTWQRNYGSDSAEEDNLHGFSSRGPRLDGGFKPTIVAPGAAISAVPTWQPGSGVPGTYELPPGYGMFNGTSMASPQAAGGAALLVSAARQRNVEHEPAQLRQAINSTTRFLDNYGAYEQGNGLLNVNKAWNKLKSTITPVAISSSVPVDTVLNDFLAEPGVGVGIYDRENVKPGESYVRQYTFTRTSGPAHPMTFKVSWAGNDGTFSAPRRILLRKDHAVKFPVRINPADAGVHSAVLKLDSPMTTGVEYQTLNTVVAAESFTEANGFSVSHGGEIGRNQTDSFFVRVAEDTPALKVDLRGGGDADGAGQVRFLRVHPYGIPIDDNSSLNCFNPPVPDGGCDGGSPTSRTVSDPTPGVWEIVVEARRTSDADFAPYTVTTSALGATVTPNPDTIESATIGEAIDREYELTNAFGPFTGRAVGTDLGSARIDTPTIGDGAQQQYPVTVTEGATEFRAKIGNTSDVGADLDLAVYDCTSGDCVLAGQSADGDSEEAVTVADPAPGDWVVLVAGYSVPAGETTFDYLDVFSGAAFGTLELTDTNQQRPGGSTWTVQGTVTAQAPAGQDRVLLGNVEVRTDADVVVGVGDVVIESTTE